MSIKQDNQSMPSVVCGDLVDNSLSNVILQSLLHTLISALIASRSHHLIPSALKKSKQRCRYPLIVLQLSSRFLSFLYFISCIVCCFVKSQSASIEAKTNKHHFELKLLWFLYTVVISAFWSCILCITDLRVCFISTVIDSVKKQANRTEALQFFIRLLGLPIHYRRY
jgi:hypothetical protein